MFCQKCGSQLNEGAAFCPICGSQTGAVSGIRVQGANKNNIKQINKSPKRKSKILIGLGAILYIVWAASLGSLVFALSDSDSLNIGFTVVSILNMACFLIILAEFICAFVNKKAVFVLSIIQAIVLVFNLNLLMIYMSVLDVYVRPVGTFCIFFVELPIVACALLLIGGSMFRTANVINELSGGTQ